MLFLAPGFMFPSAPVSLSPYGLFMEDKPVISTGSYIVRDGKAIHLQARVLAQTTISPPSPKPEPRAVEDAVDRYEEVVRAPYDYLRSLPGKDIRGKLIAAFDEWLQVPADKLIIVKEAIETLHTASLLIDDIQDSSKLRRGSPVAHSIFGIAQTINSANHAYFLAQERVLALNDPRALVIFTRELLSLHRGQAMDLYWRDALICPTEEEYIEMVSNKTGGLFRLAVQLMQTLSTVNIDCTDLVELLGIIFQIRDDYMNLQADTYTKNKGFSEDITEGKFSFPIIHSIHAQPRNTQLLSILSQRTEDESVKAYATRYMESTGSLQFCLDRLDALLDEAAELVNGLEQLLGPSKGIRDILALLRVTGRDR
ncbi:FPP/GGPP synthase family protein [Aspergillus candidus]|uniref:(2E,6E)-farnesyl diphosphate synthase n=1 Tax=Aspergillus candidus TaxID=41067 RepID=A0A2I2FD66_ASPCN|nr:terpenoid synthase [Aspergillus candidus]PLB38596.1 terpenoid synthase [Aspergillus candidus]